MAIAVSWWLWGIYVNNALQYMFVFVYQDLLLN